MKTRIITLIVISFLLLSGNLYSQGLNSIHTPDGVNVIAVGNLGKIYRSTNAGNTWASYTYTTSNLKNVCSYENDVWIASEAGNVYKTTKINSPITVYNVGESFTINSICFLNGSLGYLCGDNGKVYKSVNGGLSWTLSNTGIPNIKLNSISFIDASKGVAAGDNGALYVTENAGTSWTQQPLSTTRNLLKVKYFTDGVIIVGEYGTIITKDGTGTWNYVTTRTDSDIRGITGSGISNARVCGGGGFIRNNLNGRSNFFNFEKNPMMANLVDIFYYNADVGFAVSSLNYAIIRTTNAGLSWELPSGTTTALNWVQKTPSGNGIGNNLCKHPKDRNSIFVVYGNKVYVSRDKGDTWNQIATISIGTSAHSFYVSPLDTNVWMAAMESNPDKVVRSTNYGVTWNTILSYNFSSYGQPLEMDQNRPNIYYFAPDGVTTGFFKSTDNGASFNSVSNNNPFTSPCDIIVMWDSSDVLFIGDDGADIFKSTNGGVNWFLVKPGSSSEIPSMCNSVFDQSICYATTWGGSQVYRTVNYGNDWSIVSNNSGSGWGSDLCHEDPTVVLTGNYGPQSYLTTNGGANFFNVNSGLAGAGAGIMVPDRSYFLNMQTGNLFKLNIVYSVLTAVNENIVGSSIPENYTLYQNYPNPFNPATTIKFDLPDAGNISLKIYNQLGRELMTLTEGFRNAGTYELNFDATDLSSGVYYYKLTMGQNIFTRKMLLMK